MERATVAHLRHYSQILTFHISTTPQPGSILTMSSTTSSTIYPLTVNAKGSPQGPHAIFFSIASIIINLMIVLWLKMAFESKLIYRILMVESIVNLVGLFGLVIIGTSVFGENPHNEVLCTCAAALSTILFFNFYLSNLLIACPR